MTLVESAAEFILVAKTAVLQRDSDPASLTRVVTRKVFDACAYYERSEAVDAATLAVVTCVRELAKRMGADPARPGEDDARDRALEALRGLERVLGRSPVRAGV